MATASGAFNSLLKPPPASSGHRRLHSAAITSFSEVAPPRASVGRRLIVRRDLRVQAVTDDDEWGREPVGNVAVADGADIAAVKSKLKEKLYGTDRGLRASSETRAEIVEVITQLEALNPTPAPTDALSLLNGKWILARMRLR